MHMLTSSSCSSLCENHVTHQVLASCIALTFSCVGWRPDASMTWPKYSTLGSKNLHLSLFNHKQLFQGFEGHGQDSVSVPL